MKHLNHYLECAFVIQNMSVNKVERQHQNSEKKRIFNEKITIPSNPLLFKHARITNAFG